MGGGGCNTFKGKQAHNSDDNTFISYYHIVLFEG